MRIPDPAIEVGGNWPALNDNETLDASVVFDKLAAVARAAPEMWPSVEFRLLGRVETQGFRPYLINAQALFDPVPEMNEPILVEPVELRRVVMTALHFAELADAWVDEEGYCFADTRFLPPPVRSLSFGRMPMDPHLEKRLLRAIPPSQSRYRVIAASGTGDQRSDVEQLMYSTFADAHMSGREWTEEYLELEWYGQGPFVSLEFPIGLRLDASYNVPAQAAEITVHYRRPFAIGHFWVRVGEHFSAAEQPLRLREEESLAQGWFKASAEVSFAHSQGYVYLGTDSRPGRVDLQIRKPIGREVSRAEGRSALLPSLYGLAGFTLAGDLQQAVLAATGRAKQSAAGRFETALANACAACGYVVFYGGKVLDTRLVDFLALDEGMGRIHAISVTTSNNILDKFRGVKLAIAQLAGDVGPSRTWRPVVITAQPRTACLEGDIVAVQTDGGVLIGGEILATLLGDVPDLEAFGKAFEQALLGQLTAGPCGARPPGERLGMRLAQEHHHSVCRVGFDAN